MEFGIQSTLRATNVTGNIPFFARLAAVRCVLRCVASIMIVSGSLALPAKPLKILSKTPKRLHLTKRL